jgi:hypothetical protein
MTVHATHPAATPPHLSYGARRSARYALAAAAAAASAYGDGSSEHATFAYATEHLSWAADVLADAGTERVPGQYPLPRAALAAASEVEIRALRNAYSLAYSGHGVPALSEQVNALRAVTLAWQHASDPLACRPARGMLAADALPLTDALADWLSALVDTGDDYADDDYDSVARAWLSILAAARRLAETMADVARAGHRAPSAGARERLAADALAVHYGAYALADALGMAGAGLSVCGGVYLSAVLDAVAPYWR